MAMPMTPSVMTAGQIERALEIFRAQLRKHATEFRSDAVQIAFGQPELGPEWLAVLRKRVDAVSSMIVGKVYPVTINYDDTFEQRLAAGCYDRKHKNITAKHFPVRGMGTGDVMTELIHFNRAITSDYAFAELDRMGYHAATIEVLLAFGAKYPEKQRKFRIVALAAVWRDWLAERNIAYLDGDGDERHLKLAYIENYHRWTEDIRFLVVPKPGTNA